MSCNAAAMLMLLLSGCVGGTYGGNALGCAVASAVIDVIEDEQLLQNATNRGSQIAQVSCSIQCLASVLLALPFLLLPLTVLVVLCALSMCYPFAAVRYTLADHMPCNGSIWDPASDFMGGKL